MTDKMQRYETKIIDSEAVMRSTGCGFGEWVMYKDHIKAMEEQAKEIERLKAENKQLSDELADRAVTAVRKMRNSPGGYNL